MLGFAHVGWLLLFVKDWFLGFIWRIIIVNLYVKLYVPELYEQKVLLLNKGAITEFRCMVGMITSYNSNTEILV